LSGCSPSAPALLSPFDATSQLWNADLTLAWAAVSGATQYFARVQGSEEVDINSGWISGTQWNIGSLRSGAYTWTVTSRNDYGSSSPSITRTFSFQEAPPELPVVKFLYVPIIRIGSALTAVTILANTADVEIGDY